MKCIPALSALASISLVGCDTFSTPMSSGSSYDPLNAPGSNLPLNTNTGPSFKPGQFVRASISNTAFFKERPKGDADADKLLARGTSMKVIATSGSYVKVELDSGDIGFVPSVMLEDPNAVAVAPVPMQGSNEYQVYPPVYGSGQGQPLPIIDPAGLPPEGAIPTVIDPEAPGAETPVPPVTPTTDTFPTPTENKMPLPPNGEEESGESAPKAEAE